MSAHTKLFPWLRLRRRTLPHTPPLLSQPELRHNGSGAATDQTYKFVDLTLEHFAARSDNRELGNPGWGHPYRGRMAGGANLR